MIRLGGEDACCRAQRANCLNFSATPLQAIASGKLATHRFGKGAQVSLVSALNGLLKSIGLCIPRQMNLAVHPQFCFLPAFVVCYFFCSLWQLCLYQTNSRTTMSRSFAFGNIGRRRIKPNVNRRIANTVKNTVASKSNHPSPPQTVRVQFGFTGSAVSNCN